MKKQIKQNNKSVKEKQNELQTITEMANPENRQPVPQPKDYDEIEY